MPSAVVIDFERAFGESEKRRVMRVRPERELGDLK